MRIREAALRHAALFIGTTEQPPGSNRGPLIDKWNKLAGVPVGSYWCCSFMHSMFHAVGFYLPGGASVGNLMSAAKAKGWVVARPFRGDLVCFEFNEGGYAYDDHVGIVERVLALRWSNGKFTGYIQTIEGNTSTQADPTGSQSNGGGVFRRRRWIRGIGARFVRVPGDVAL